MSIDEISEVPAQDQELKTTKPASPSALIPLMDVGFANEEPMDPVVKKRIADVTLTLLAKGENINPFIIRYFENPRLFNALPPELRDSDQALGEYITNTGRFDDLIHRERQARWQGDITGLFGEEVHAPEVPHADGRTRKSESGYKINIDGLSAKGVDPAKVLFFRLTQPADDLPKPEYYWTSDFSETSHGLNMEVSPEKRSKAVILVDSLDNINKNGGLIQDINDDRGLAVRQIGTAPYDQGGVIAKIPAA